MAMSNAQILTVAQSIAKTPGFVTTAGLQYNAILEELAESFDFDLMKITNFSVTTNSTQGISQGPYNLPTNYLRAAKDEQNYTISGEPQMMVQISMAEWRALFMGQGVPDYPINFATDFSTVQTLGFPQAYVWPPANGAYVIQWPYFQKHTYIDNPATDSNSPWFPMSTYLYTRLAAEQCKISDDSRAMALNKEAEDMLRKYLEMKDDPEGYVKQVTLDRRIFRSPYRGLRATKAEPL